VLGREWRGSLLCLWVFARGVAGGLVVAVAVAVVVVAVVAVVVVVVGGRIGEGRTLLEGRSG